MKTMLKLLTWGRARTNYRCFNHCIVNKFTNGRLQKIRSVIMLNLLWQMCE